VHYYSFSHIARIYVCTQCMLTPSRTLHMDLFWCVSYPFQGSAHLFIFQARVRFTLHYASRTHRCSIHFVCHVPFSCTHVFPVLFLPFGAFPLLPFISGFHFAVLSGPCQTRGVAPTLYSAEIPVTRPSRGLPPLSATESAPARLPRLPRAALGSTSPLWGH
jgi:hypothetical protein